MAHRLRGVEEQDGVQLRRESSQKGAVLSGEVEAQVVWTQLAEAARAGSSATARFHLDAISCRSERQVAERDDAATARCCFDQVVIVLPAGLFVLPGEAQRNGDVDSGSVHAAQEVVGSGELRLGAGV